ncbi:glycosyltransferase [Shewanella youngdeokensis]|uniref:Glycosyltransferase n=1 Tax=Shewanella youngdeokensis TaxID=2999068 RepID=A0ABZ0K2I0_9GAMM|nr:glycosyltransferase [Shewanella sp. DAU334]
MKQILIISPIPSHPQNQGNSARIYQLCKMWQTLGFRVHFIYFGLEGLTEQQSLQMTQCWDHFYYVQPQGGAAEPSFGDFFHVDDWYDERVSTLVAELCSIWTFSHCVVNYVWFSKALEVVPDSVIKVIDTHDVFGDRHLVAKAAGMEPVWFYTSKALEAMALNRADLVLAIQDEEAEYFNRICDAQVEVVGYVVPPEILLPAPKATNGKIRIGYLGSGNPFNVASIISFQQHLLSADIDLSRFEFHLAGSVCNGLADSTAPFIVHGMVDSLSDFYRQMDIMVNPMLGGTGLKIKSIEALAFGRPLIATVDAMVGIEVDNPHQTCALMTNVVDSCNAMLNNNEINQLYQDSLLALEKYNSRFISSFRALFS